MSAYRARVRSHSMGWGAMRPTQFAVRTKYILSKPRQFGTCQSPAQSTGPLSSSIAFNYVLFLSPRGSTAFDHYAGGAVHRFQRAMTIALVLGSPSPLAADSGTRVGGLAHLPVNLFVYISVCTQRGGSKLTPKVYIWMAEIILFYEFPMLSKMRPDLCIS